MEDPLHIEIIVGEFHVLMFSKFSLSVILIWSIFVTLH